MSLSRVVAILLLIIQVANMGMFFVEQYAPDYAVLVTGIVGALQAFVSKVQGSASV